MAASYKKYKIADLIVELYAEDGLAALCESYAYEGTGETDILIDPAKYRPEAWPMLSGLNFQYMESGEHFYYQLLEHGGMMLHASCIVIEGKAYLFSGPSGHGKSTHTELLHRYFGGEIINDDKPALRCIDGNWIAYGTPWSGKNHTNRNKSAPLAGICFLTEDRSRNELRRTGGIIAIRHILSQTLNHMSGERMSNLLALTELLIGTVPIYELDSLANEETARLLMSTMCSGGQ